MEELQDFYNRHVGETCLLVGNGPNLTQTPPEWFDYPSFGMNTCHLWPNIWKPTYYCAVDQRVKREFGKVILDKFADIPKFIPRPNLNKWAGPNFYRFLHRPGGLQHPDHSPTRATALTTDGIGYTNVMHVAIQIAWHMGFTKFLMIGVQHRPHKAQVHFWGTDHGMPAMHYPEWLEDYAYLAQRIDLVNISTDTHLAPDIIPRDNWQKYANRKATIL